MPEPEIIELRLTRQEAHVVLRALASHNAGDNWQKLRREFTEIRAISWVPN